MSRELSNAAIIRILSGLDKRQEELIKLFNEFKVAINRSDRGEYLDEDKVTIEDVKNDVGPTCYASVGKTRIRLTLRLIPTDPVQLSTSAIDIYREVHSLDEPSAWKKLNTINVDAAGAGSIDAIGISRHRINSNFWARALVLYNLMLAAGVHINFEWMPN